MITEFKRVKKMEPVTVEEIRSLVATDKDAENLCNILNRIIDSHNELVADYMKVKSFLI